MNFLTFSAFWQRYKTDGTAVQNHFVRRRKKIRPQSNGFSTAVRNPFNSLPEPENRHSALIQSPPNVKILWFLPQKRLRTTLFSTISPSPKRYFAQKTEQKPSLRNVKIRGFVNASSVSVFSVYSVKLSPPFYTSIFRNPVINLWGDDSTSVGYKWTAGCTEELDA